MVAAMRRTSLLEHRIGERDRAHRPHLAALERRRHQGAEGGGPARLEDEVVAAGQERLDVGRHLEPIELARGAGQHRRERMRPGRPGQQRPGDGTADRPAADEADSLHPRRER